MPYKMLYNAAMFMVLVITMVAIVQLAKHVIPVDYTKAFFWSLKQKKFLLPILSPLLLLFAAIMVSGAFNITATLAAGQGSKVFVVGATEGKMFYIDPDRPEGEVRTHEGGPFTLYKRSQYPGQNFDEAFHGEVFILLPWNKQALVIPHHLVFYLFFHFMVYLLVVLAWGAAAYLLMQYSVGLKSLPHLLDGPGLAALFLERTGFSMYKALAGLALALIGLAVANSYIDNRFDPLREEMKAPETMWKERILSKARPGAVLKGRILQKEKFVVQGHTSSARSDDDRRPSTPSVDYRAYLVEFRGLAPFPLYVNITEYDDSYKWSEKDKARIAREDALAASKGEAAFLVKDDLSISLAE